MESVDLSVCVDCLLLFANGEVFDPHGNDISAEHAMRVAARWSDVSSLVAGGDDLGFSGADCGGCGDALAGDRFTAAYLFRAVDDDPEPDDEPDDRCYCGHPECGAC